MPSLVDDLRFALDPVAFAVEVLDFPDPDPWQIQAIRWPGKRLMLNCHRQSGKSTIAAILAVHGAVYQPGILVLLISPSLRQSGELFKKITTFMERVENKPIYDEDNKLSFTLATGSRVVSLPNSEATIRGFSSVDLIIEDEASRVGDDLYYAIRPMLAVSNGRLILMSTPFGRMGHFYETWTASDSIWEKVLFDVSKSTRVSKEFLESERKDLPDRVFRQEYKCEFLETEDVVFSLEDFDRAITDQVKPLFGGLRP